MSVGKDGEARNDWRTSFEGRIYADQTLLAESPVLQKTGPKQWHFDMPIPPGTRQIRFVVSEAHNRNHNDWANWVQTGFKTGKSD